MPQAFPAQTPHDRPIMRRRQRQPHSRMVPVAATAVALLLLLPTLGACGSLFGVPATAVPSGTVSEAPGASGAAPSEGGTSAASSSQNSETGVAGSESAAGSETASEQPPKDPLHLPTPKNVRGIYLTGWTAGSPKRLQDRIDYIKKNGLNTMVIDIKDEDRMSFPLPGTEAAAIHESRNKIPHIKDVLKQLHDNGIYVIGRIVTFNDSWAAEHHRDWAIKENGKLFTDHQGYHVLSIFNEDARAYNIEIGVQSAKLGFDEIQYDYIRLPAKIIPGYNDKDNAEDRVAAVTGFLKEARDTINREAGVPVSGDVFGISSVVQGDSQIGQRYPDIAHVLDYISPMDYPSLYRVHEFGFDNAAKRPYDTVWLTVADAELRTADLPIGVQRPWIQDFDLRGVDYGPKQVEAQLEALANAGIHSFLLWNAGNIYTDGVDFSVIDNTPLKVPNQIWLKAIYNYVHTNVPVLLPASIPAPQARQALSVATGKGSDGYTGEVWSTPEPLATNDGAVSSGTLELVVQGAKTAAKLADLPAVAAPRPANGSETTPSEGDDASEAGASGSVASEAAQTVQLKDGTSAWLAPSGSGYTLTWTHGAAVYRVWAQSAEQATTTADSMVKITLLEGR